MKVDCRWFNAHLEGYFCESLGIEDFQLASEHAATCATCRSSVNALQETDPLIRQVLEYRVAKARQAAFAPRRSLGFQLGLAGAGMALAALLVLAVYVRQTASPAGLVPATQTAAQNPDSSKTSDGKAESSAPIDRAKPDAPAPKSPSENRVPEPSVSENAPEFQVINPEGHDMNLQDFRGRILLFGVWSADQPDAALNLQRLYQAFGTRHDVRILGVTSHNQNRMAGITFPLVFNNGSRLLETASSNFTVVDKEGVVRMRGSLKGSPNALIAQIKGKLDELAGK